MNKPFAILSSVFLSAVIFTTLLLSGSAVQAADRDNIFLFIPAILSGTASCNSSHLDLCTTETTCTGAGGFWWSHNRCHSSAEPASIYFETWEGLIIKIDTQDHLDGDSETVYPEQLFAVVSVDVKNLDFVSDYVSRYDLKIEDSMGRQFDMAELEAQWAAQDQYSRTGVYNTIQPSFTGQQIYVFDLALDSKNFKLVAVDSQSTQTPNPLPSPVIDLNTQGQFDDWQYTVTGVSLTNTLHDGDSNVQAKGTFLIVLVTVMNLGVESDHISSYDFVAQDSVTRQFDMAELEAQWAAQDQYSRTGVYDTIQPSFTEQQIYVFDIMPESTGMYLLPTNSGDAVNLNM